MLYFVFGVLGIFLSIFLLKKLLKVVIVVAGAALSIVMLVSMGPAVLLSFLLEKCSSISRNKIVIPCIMLGAFSVFVSWVFLHGSELGLYNQGFIFYRNIITVLFAIGGITLIIENKNLYKINANKTLLLKKESLFIILFFTGILLAVCAIISPFSSDLIKFLTGWEKWISTGYWISSIFVQIAAISMSYELQAFCKKIHHELTHIEICSIESHSGNLIKEDTIDEDDAQSLYFGCVALLTDKGILNEYEILSKPWVFNAEYDDINHNKLKNKISPFITLELSRVVKLVSEAYELNDAEARDFLEFSSRLGQIYGIGENTFFVPNEKIDNIRVCTSCGHAEEGITPVLGEWFCSDTCRETEALCLEIKNKSDSDFLSSTVSSGFILMEGGQALNTNHKVFADGGQGHGFAAENANHRIDKLLMKDAEIVGSDNAKNGADRLVNGKYIQTKYCKTAARSIGAGFDGQGGNYKYLDAQGKPMQIEVPKDQYELAIKTMEKRIKEGRVPGINDPKQADKLVVKGHLTYDQAKNITKFGTIESLTYDLSEGVVIGAAAGGISFALSAAVFYANTGDKKKSIEVATIQGGKTFGKSLAVYVGTQQLNRLATVQRVLGKIDISALSYSKKNLLQKGFGVNSSNNLNKVLRGTIITSVVLIAVTTGPDLIKMIRGRISKAQFVKNLAVVSSGIVGGTIGSIAGGIIFSPFGPLSSMIGRTAGGIIGGGISSLITNKFAGKIMEEDRAKMIKLIEQQLEYLSVNFMLTKNEIKNLNSNLDNILEDKTLEIIHAAKNEQRAMTNYILKPIVVSVVKQRPKLTYDNNDILLACEDMVA